VWDRDRSEVGHIMTNHNDREKHRHEGGRLSDSYTNRKHLQQGTERSKKATHMNNEKDEHT